MNQDIFERAKEYSKGFQDKVNAAYAEVNTDDIAKVAALLYEAKENGKTIFFFGNGGSMSIATHFACDFGKGTKFPDKPNQKFYKAKSLDNIAWLTAQANDGAGYFKEKGYPGEYLTGYDGIFIGQMENFLEEGDIAFGISSSGNSPNVVQALEFAKNNGAVTIAMVGFDGGKAAQVADHQILVPTAKGEYGVVEGVHELIHHELYEFARMLESE